MVLAPLSETDSTQRRQAAKAQRKISRRDYVLQPSVATTKIPFRGRSLPVTFLNFFRKPQSRFFMLSFRGSIRFPISPVRFPFPLRPTPVCPTISTSSSSARSREAGRCCIGSPEWPLKYRDFEPYYTQAEELYQVHGKEGTDPSEPWRSKGYPFPPISHEPRIKEV